MANLSTRLRELRNSAGLSQQALADKTSISKSSINMYERGDREPGLETIEMFADYFNVDLDYLLGKSDIPRKSFINECGEIHTSVAQNDLTPVESEMLDLFRQLTPTDQAKEIGRMENIIENYQNEKTTVFRAAKSTDNHESEIVETTKDFSKIPPTDIKL